ncbi:MAG: hypothetical protein HYT28_00950 [Parcubacteria group bacterium]|nr:hypothetical protein [Parcubacteria group bacterium]
MLKNSGWARRAPHADVKLSFLQNPDCGVYRKPKWGRAYGATPFRLPIPIFNFYHLETSMKF